METKEIFINPDNIDASLANEAGSILKNGGLVAFPTETVYGLGANAFDDVAVGSIFTAKGRPNDNPLIVHVASKEDVEELVESVSEKAKLVMDKFWPGPISIIMKKSDKIGDAVSAGLDTVAVRMPSHPVALALIKAAGVPVAAPSANTSGKPSPTSAKHVREDMYGKIDMIVDGGRCLVGVESTVLDLSGDEAVILRPGGITASMLESVIGKVKYSKQHVADENTPRCPGMKYRHYAPKASVYVLEYKNELDKERVDEMICEHKKNGARVGILDCADNGFICGADRYTCCGESSKKYAENLFYLLRDFDENGIDVILCPMNFCDDMSNAVKNRLYKAASNNILNFEKGNDEHR